MKKILLLSLLVLFGCSKGELPDSNYAGIFDPEVMYDLSVDTTRFNATPWHLLNATPYVPGSYSHGPQANNHPGYGFSGSLNIEYNNTYIWGKESWNESLSPGTDVKLTALPALGFEFLEWSNGVTENPINIKMNSDIDLTAVFKTD